jgi:CheY-like chemotaxis protein
MTDDVAQRAMEPFFTTKGQSGSGLGMSQVQAMARESGGALRLWTRLGRGTTITLLLPRANVGPIQPEVPIRHPGERRQETMLVVDDDPNVIEVTADMVRQLDYSVILAQGGPQALELWDSTERLPGVVLLDFAMPMMSGLLLAQELRERGFAGPIILATGCADISEIDDAELGLVQAVLTKPYTFHELEETLSRFSGWSATPMRRQLIEAE